MAGKAQELPSGVEVGAAIRGYRHACGLTQAQLADAACLSVGQVRDLEQGRTRSPRWASVLALAVALGLGESERVQLVAAWQGGNCSRPPSARRRTDRRHASGADTVTVRILGPLVAERAGCPIDLGPARRKAILALMALRGEVGVRMSELTELFWPGRQPASADSIVQGHVSRLRELLSGSPQAHVRIAWTGELYQLRSGRHLRLDSVEFERFGNAGDKAASAGEPGRACGFYQQALGLWRGDAIADLDWLREHPLAVNLNTLRSEVTLRFADASAMAGDHARALPQLREACAREPLSEVLHSRFIAVLGAAGRRSEAVKVFDGLRHRLDRELGITPSHAVWQAYGLVIGAGPDRADPRFLLLASKTGR